MSDDNQETVDRNHVERVRRRLSAAWSNGMIFGVLLVICLFLFGILHRFAPNISRMAADGIPKDSLLDSFDPATYSLHFAFALGVLGGCLIVFCICCAFIVYQCIFGNRTERLLLRYHDMFYADELPPVGVVISVEPPVTEADSSPDDLR